MDVGRGAHLVGIPQRAGDVDALEPRHAVEVLGDEHHHVLGAALALRGGPADVGHPRAAEQRALDRPPVRDPPHVALELAVVELSSHAQRIVDDGAAAGKDESLPAAREDG